MACSSGRKLEVSMVPEQFPVGLRVLVVDDDDICLRVLEQMLRRCMYQVTSCSQAIVALNLLRERKGCFDLVLSDVHMPDMDGLKLLELVGLEMDLPVIMMSVDGRTNLVMQGIQNGACDYLIKPIRDEELKNIWQHVVRKRCNDLRKHDQSVDEGGDEAGKSRKKRGDSKDGDHTEPELDDQNTFKKPRVVWSVELHQQFVSAVNQLGIKEAVPKRILELMNVPGLTRENVASHLQKFRLYRKRFSGVPRRGILPSYCGSVEENLKLASLGRLEILSLAASGQLPTQILPTLQSELLSRSSTNFVLTAIRPEIQSHSSLPASECIPADPNPAAYDNACLEISGCSSKNPCGTIPDGNLVTNAENSDVLLSYMQEQKEKQSESTRSVDLRPACLDVAYFHEESGLISINQSVFRRNGSSPAPEESSPFFVPPVEAERKRPEFVAASSVWENSHNKSNMNFSYGELNRVSGSAMNAQNPCRMSSIPSRFAVDEYEDPTTRTK